MMIRLPRSSPGSVGQLPPAGVPTLCDFYPNDPACHPPPPPEPESNWAMLIVPPVVTAVAVFVITRQLNKVL
jgi:hypothetical protein